MEWRLKGGKATIINHRLHDAYVVDKASNNLYPLPQELFDMPRAESIAESLLHNDEEKFTPPKKILTESSEVKRSGAKFYHLDPRLKRSLKDTQTDSRRNYALLMTIRFMIYQSSTTKTIATTKIIS